MHVIKVLICELCLVVEEPATLGSVPVTNSLGYARHFLRHHYQNSQDETHPDFTWSPAVCVDNWLTTSQKKIQPFFLKKRKTQMSHCPCFVRGEWEKAGLWADNHMFTVLEQRFEILFRWHSLWLEEVKGSSQARNGARHTKPNHRQPLPLIITAPTSSCSVSHSTSRGLLSGRLSSASPWSQDRDLSPSRSCTVCLIFTQVCSVRGLTQPYWYLPNPATLLMGRRKAVTVLIIVWRASVCTGGSPVEKLVYYY